MNRPTIVLLVLALTSAAHPATAQEPDTGSIEIARVYRVIAMGNQLTGDLFEGRETIIGYGRLRGFGSRRAWLGSAELELGLIPGRAFLDGLILGPRLSLRRTLPRGLLDLMESPSAWTIGAHGRLAGTWQFAGIEAEQGTRLVPALGAGIGYRWSSLMDAAALAFTLEVERRLDPWETVLFLRIEHNAPR
ncbi:MAG: hypothetical protein ACRELD_15305 [Longimicrobiales bacterium]